jgi:2-keto-4-pentenoate hydratase/2-oxohepta-3-ene-1,7-dioic acid hydratase in catechol pathway
MRVGRFTQAGRSAAGIVDGALVHRLEPWREHRDLAQGLPWHPFELPALGTQAIADLPVLETLALEAVTPALPIDLAAKLICIGLNYREHAQEAQRETAAQPGLFLRTADTLQPHGAPLLRPRASACYDFEGEIAVVIGKPGRAIAVAQAMDHVFGYTCLMDGSVRDFQKHSVSAGKNFWRSGAIGPWIVTADEVPDWRRLKLSTRLNGEPVQQTEAAMMIHGIPELIAYVSQWTPLRPGDVIATGTPSGVGLARTPPLWMKAGDRIEVAVDAVGVLANTVEDEA